MKHEARPVADERVTQETNRIGGSMFRWGVYALVAMGFVKGLCIGLGAQWLVILPEAAGLVAGGAALVIGRTAKGLWGPSDERTEAEMSACLSNAWAALFCVSVLTCVPLLFLAEPQALVLLTLVMMALLNLCGTVRMSGKGLMLPVRGRSVKKRLIWLTLAVLALGLMMSAVVGHVTGISFPLWAYAVVEVMLLFSCLLGGWLAIRLTKRSEEIADEAVKAAEESNEE